MLRRISQSSTVKATGHRHFGSFGAQPTSNWAHPDVACGYAQSWYRGRGWAAFHKVLPQERMLLLGGSGSAAVCTRQVAVPDPEDPRHPMVKCYYGGIHNMQHSTDGTIHQVLDQHMAPISKGSRFMQLLYENYLEPINLTLNIVSLGDMDRCPNQAHHRVEAHYPGMTALIGDCTIGRNSTIMHSSVLKGDTNNLFLQNGCQVLENCVITAENTDIASHYTRDEKLNPYQIQDLGGHTQVHQFCIVEPNVYIESSKIGPYSKIGHNSKICRNCNLDTMTFVMPGSVVAPYTRTGEGEIWGGSPAIKLGKVNKWEFKRPGDSANFHKDAYRWQFLDYPVVGPQVAYQLEAFDDVNDLMVELEDSLPPSLQERIRYFVEGVEPYRLKVARMSQGWQPYHGEMNYGDNGNHQPLPNFFTEPNDDTITSPEAGSLLNCKSGPAAIINEKRMI